MTRAHVVSYCARVDDDGNVRRYRVQQSFERLASLEGRAQEQARMVDVIRDGMAGLASRMDSLDSRMATFEIWIVGLEERMDRRFEQVDRRFEQIDARFIAVDGRFIAIDERLDRMSAQLSNLIIGVAVAAVSGVLGMITAMIR